MCGSGSDEHKSRTEAWHVAKWSEVKHYHTVASVFCIDLVDLKHSGATSVVTVDVDGGTTLFNLVRYIAELHCVKACQVRLLKWRNWPVDETPIFFPYCYTLDMAHFDAQENDELWYTIK